MICALTDPRHLDPKLFAFWPICGECFAPFCCLDFSRLNVIWISSEMPDSDRAHVLQYGNGFVVMISAVFSNISKFVFYTILFHIFCIFRPNSLPFAKMDCRFGERMWCCSETPKNRENSHDERPRIWNFRGSAIFSAWEVKSASHPLHLSLIHIWRCRRIERCRSRWSPYH